MPRSPAKLSTWSARCPGALAAAWTLALAHGAWTGQAHAAETLKAFTVGGAEAGGLHVTDAVVEAQRDAGVVSQVAGRIVALTVRAGQRVQAGQVLARIESSVVNQQLAGSQAQLAQAEAQALVARHEAERARQLFAKAYVSQAALDQAEAQARATQAQVKAMQAQVGATSAQAGLHVLRAPFAGWVAQVPVSLGDAAGPGQVLMQVYDPSALRVTAQVPESVASRLQARANVTLTQVSHDGASPAGALSLSGLPAEVLPAVDPVTRTVTVRVALPAGTRGVQPGQSARLSLAWAAGESGALGAPTGAARRLSVPRAAVVTRSELQAVYIIGADGGARLRQVRLGRAQGDVVEVLAGLGAGERVALDPVAAARTAPAHAHAPADAPR
jgi:membrane fusion protein, multidrug efflux system